jgi:DNA-binding PadR family transcriptional regulator
MSQPPISRATVDVLALLLDAWQDGVELHGWEIMRRTRRSGPTVYTVLDRLEDAGWIGASWEVLPPGQGRPRRRYYRLTAAGAETARDRLAGLRPVGSPPLRPRPQFGFSPITRPAG